MSKLLKIRFTERCEVFRELQEYVFVLTRRLVDKNDADELSFRRSEEDKEEV